MVQFTNLTSKEGNEKNVWHKTSVTTQSHKTKLYGSS